MFFPIIKNILQLRLPIGYQTRCMGFMKYRSEYWREKIGNREMVGYGINGMPIYFDRVDFPFPAIRFKENTPDVEALFEKQRGDWKLLSIQEKKQIYRINYRSTFSEFTAPTGQWMEIIGWVLTFACVGVWLQYFVGLAVNPELPDSFLRSHKRAQLRRQLDLKVNPIEGLASEWDYEKCDWKKYTWRTPPNPFIKCADDENLGEEFEADECY